MYVIVVSIGALSHFIDPRVVARKKFNLLVFLSPFKKENNKNRKKMMEASASVGLALAIAVDPQLKYPKC